MNRCPKPFLLLPAVLALLGLTIAGGAPTRAQGMMPYGGMRRGGMMGGGMMGGGGRGPGAYVPPGTSGGANVTNPIPASPESIAQGKALFGSRCAACHGAGGRGDGPAARGLNPPPANLAALAGMRSEGALYAAISYGRGAMPAFQASLSATQRWNLVNFIRSLAH